MDVEKTLLERGNKYGEFDEHARITQSLKQVMRSGVSWPSMRPDEHEALDMIAHKIGRICNGDPHYADSWHDIIGYARLVESTLDHVGQT